MAAIRLMLPTRRLVAALLLLVFSITDASRIGSGTQAAPHHSSTNAHIPKKCAGLIGDKLTQCIQHTTAHDRRMQEEASAAIIIDIPAACVGWKENKIQECIAEQELIGSILSQNNLDSIPLECTGLNTDKLGECLSQRQSILDQNGVTTIPSECQGLGVDKLEACIVNHHLVQTILSQNNLESIPSECAGLNTDKLGECLSQRQSILDQNGVTTIPSECQGLGVDKLEACIMDHDLIQTILTAYNLEDIPLECAGENADKLGECLSQRQSILDQNGVTTIPSECQGLGVDKLEACIMDHDLIQTILTAYNLEDIPLECAGENADKLGECLSQRQSILDQNGVTTIPSECQGLGVDKLEACIMDHDLIQTILTAYNLEDIPLECAGENADKLTECLHQWRLTQIIHGKSNERIPPQCVGMQKEKDLEACLEDFTLAPTHYPTYSPTEAYKTYPPTAYSTEVPTGSPIDWNALATTVEFASKGRVAIPIGRFAMSVTTYVNKKEKWKSDRRLIRVLQKHNDGNHPRQHELDATRKHLLEVYNAEFQIPVASVELHFVDGGETAMGLKVDGTIGDGVMRHSIFFGNALFVEDDELSPLLPTEEQMEKATIKAFTGERKQAFIEKYHYEVTGRRYFGIKYSYDVSVRKSLQVDVVVPPTVDLPAEDPPEGADQEGLSLVARIQQWVSSDESLGSSTIYIVFILLAGILLGALIGLTAVVVRRKRSNRAQKQQPKVMGDFIDDEPDALGSVIDSEIENGSDMLYLQYEQSLNQVQTSLPIIADDFDDSISQLATSYDTVDKVMEKEGNEADSGESTKEIESGDSDSTWSYSLKSAGSGDKSRNESETVGDNIEVGDQLT